MHVKKYSAANIQEALKLVKEELGSQAMIISTENLGPAAGTRKGHRVEVTAATDHNYNDDTSIYRPEKKTGSAETSDTKEIISSLQEEILELKKIVKSISLDLQGPIARDADGFLRKETIKLKSIVQCFLKDNSKLKDIGIYDFLIHYYEKAVKKGINQNLAFRLIDKANREIAPDASLSETDMKSRLFTEMKHFIKVSGPIKTVLGKQKVVAVVGPTGVGKTTTVAKLAADFSLNKNKEVALITLDTYRIGAIEQLQIYSKIMDIPLSVAENKETFTAALNRYQDKDIIFIDTAGRSRKDKKQMEELINYFDGDIPIERHLVLSSVDQEENLISNIRRFYPLSFDRIIFTKIDEANSFGNLFNICMTTNKPISYFTTGQKVPEDIEAATADKTIDLIFQ